MRATQAAAYAVVEKIQFDGAHFRRDIAAKEVNYCPSLTGAVAGL